MKRRGINLTPAQVDLYDHVFDASRRGTSYVLGANEQDDAAVLVKADLCIEFNNRTELVMRQQ